MLSLTKSQKLLVWALLATLIPITATTLSIFSSDRADARSSVRSCKTKANGKTVRGTIIHRTVNRRVRSSGGESRFVRVRVNYCRPNRVARARTARKPVTTTLTPFVPSQLGLSADDVTNGSTTIATTTISRSQEAVTTSVDVSTTLVSAPIASAERSSVSQPGFAASPTGNESTTTVEPASGRSAPPAPQPVSEETDPGPETSPTSSTIQVQTTTKTASSTSPGGTASNITSPQVPATTGTTTATTTATTNLVTPVASTTTTTHAPQATTTSTSQTTTTSTSAPSVTSTTSQVVVTPQIVLPAALRTIVIAPGGSDSNPGTESSPRRTLSGVRTGDLVLFRGGRYTGVAADWSNISNVRLHNFPNEVPVFDGELRYGEFLVLRDGTSNIEVRGLTITRYANQYGNGAITAEGNSKNVRIENNLFDGNGTDRLLDHQIYLGSGSSLGRIENWSIVGNTFTNTMGAAIHSYGTDNARNVLVQQNKFLGGRWGILISDEGQSNWDIVSNSFSEVTETAVILGNYRRTVRSDVTQIRLSRNVISTVRGGFAIRVDSPQVRSGALVDLGNLYWSSGSPIALWNWPDTGQQLNLAALRNVSVIATASTSVSPGFVDSALTLPSGSPVAGWGA